MNDLTNFEYSSNNLSSCKTSQQKDPCTIDMTGEQLMAFFARLGSKKSK